MDLMPLLSTLRRHKTACALIVVEVALTCAIIVNALHLIGLRLTALNRDSGMAESELVVLAVRFPGIVSNPDELTARDLQALRALPGVKSATTVNQVPYGNNNNFSSVGRDPGRRDPILSANNYNAGENALATFGLKLVEGRDFKAEEVQQQSILNNPEEPNVGQVIINRTMARKLVGDGSALGYSFFVYGTSPSKVIGVVEQLSQSNPGKAREDEEAYAMLFALRPNVRNGAYLLRVTDPSQRESVMKAGTAALERIDGNRVVTDARTIEEMRKRYYAQDRSMAWLLVTVCAGLLTITAFGIVGLASFWVEQRTRMIGTRRALGATRGQILRYFQAENFLLTAAGVVLGTLGAYAIGLVLMQSYELPRLPWAYLAVGAPVLFALGQLAVLAPARRAAALPPVAALRA